MYILANTFFAFWHLFGEYYLIIWAYTILVGLVFILIDIFMKK